MNATQRLNLPFILPGQAQKELLHNEALQQIDLLIAGTVEEPPRSDVPASPVPGQCHIIGPNPTGSWALRAGQLAAYTEAGWRFVAPVEGMEVLVRSTDETATYRKGAWELGVVRGRSLVLNGKQLVGNRRGAIADPAGGAQADAEARAAITAILAALRSHGLIEPS